MIYLVVLEVNLVFLGVLDCVVYFQFPKIFKRPVLAHSGSYRHGTMPKNFLLKFCSELVCLCRCFY